MAPQDAAPTTVSNKARIVGWVLTLLPSALLTFSGVMKFIDSDELKKGFEHLGIGYDLAKPLGVLELSCVAVYLFPRTSILGAILIAGYMGGAILAHLRINEGFGPQIAVGVFVWLGLFLREPRLRQLVPWRRAPSKV
ncbi:MAG: DoxX family protein [Planctomycetota bacterium]|nr:DoxX family protein [Planctomycetota bacterium]